MNKIIFFMVVCLMLVPSALAATPVLHYNFESDTYCQTLGGTTGTDLRCELETNRQVSSGLLGLWHLNNNALDSTANNLDGTVATGSNPPLGSSGWPGKFGPYTLGSGWIPTTYQQSYYFQGITNNENYIQIDDGSNTLAASSGLTIAGWLKLDNQISLDYERVFSKYNFGAQQGYTLAITPNNGYFIDLWTTSGVNRQAYTGNNIATDGNWDYVVATYDGLCPAVYINGVLRSVTPAGGGTNNCGANQPIRTTPWTTEAQIGRDATDSGHYIQGQIEELGVWNRALSSAEVTELYNKRIIRDAQNNNDARHVGGQHVSYSLQNYMLFDNDDRVESSYSVPQGSTSNSATFCAWVYPTTTSGSAHIVSTENGGNDWAIVRQGSNWGLNDGLQFRSAAPVIVNEWQYVCAAFGTTAARFYLNGVHVGGSWFIGNPAYRDSSTSSVWVGSSPLVPGAQTFTGRIDEVKVWTTELSASEIMTECLGSVPAAVLPPNCADIQPPTVTITNPVNTTYNAHRTQITFTATDDRTITECQYRKGNQYAWFESWQPAGVTGGTISNVGSSIEGVNLWQVRCSDGTNWGTGQVVFSVDTTGPSITISLPANDTTYTSVQNSISFTANDGSGLNFCGYFVPITSSPVITHSGISGTFLADTVAVPPTTGEGIFTWAIGCYDDLGNYAQMPTTFTVDLPDTTAPQINITNPLSITYTSDRAVISANISDEETGIQNCSVQKLPQGNTEFIDAGTVVPGTMFDQVSWSTDSQYGWNTWTFICQDRAPTPNVGSDSVTFYVDPSVDSITTCGQLQLMKWNLTKNYTLANDIDCTDTINWNSGDGFEPIGTTATPFAGSFDGNEFQITNLHIDRNNNIGLFGATASNAHIHHVWLENISITGNDNVGGLVGVDAGLIEQVLVTGSINSGNVQGGLVGQKTAGTINNSYVEIQLSGDEIRGGLVGELFGTIANSYAIVNTTGNVETGGVVGRVQSGQLTNIFSIPRFTSSCNAGDCGSIAGTNLGTINNAYWYDDILDSMNDCIGTGSGTCTDQNSLAYFRGYDVYPGVEPMNSWDFFFVWAERENSSPTFRWISLENPDAPVDGINFECNLAGNTVYDVNNWRDCETMQYGEYLHGIRGICDAQSGETVSEAQLYLLNRHDDQYIVNPVSVPAAIGGYYQTIIAPQQINDSGVFEMGLGCDLDPTTRCEWPIPLDPAEWVGTGPYFFDDWPATGITDSYCSNNFTPSYTIRNITVLVNQSTMENTLQCYVKSNDCDPLLGEVGVASLSTVGSDILGKPNVHTKPYDETNPGLIYNKHICCQANITAYNIGQGFCSEDSAISFAQQTNSHAAGDHPKSRYDYSTCLVSTDVTKQMNCTVQNVGVLDCNDAFAGSECVGRMAKNGNSHIQDCNENTFPYALCCRIEDR